MPFLLSKSLAHALHVSRVVFVGWLTAYCLEFQFVRFCDAAVAEAAAIARLLAFEA